MFWAFVCFCVFAIMFALNWKLAAIIMLVVPFIAGLTFVFQKKMLFWNRDIREVNSEITGAFNEGSLGVETSKDAGDGELNDHTFCNVTGRMKSHSMTLARRGNLYADDFVL